MKFLKTGLYFFIVLLLTACAATQPFTSTSKTTSPDQPILESEIDYEVYLVGDVGANSTQINNSDIVSLIKSQLKHKSDYQSVVFLGNTLSDKGLPDEEEDNFKKVSNDIEYCVRELKDNTDKVYFIPGNYEWSDGKEYTLDAVQSSEEFIEEKAGGKNIVAPSKGCGTPKVVKLSDDLILVLIDSQWLLQGDFSGERQRGGCEIDDEIEFVTALQEILSKNKLKNVIIAAHHPVFSNGITGGNYPAKSHMIPLPGVGSIATGFKKLGATQQHFGHPQYEAYRTAMLTALGFYEGVINVSAHDHNLQYSEFGSNHYIVAGSGNDVDYLRKGGDLQFGYMQQGFAKITHTKNMELWLEFYVADENDKTKAVSVYKKLLYKKEKIDFEDEKIYKETDDYPNTVTTKASGNYSKRGIAFFNKLYRKEWGTEIEFENLILDEIDGGLIPVQQGGGFQTKSLRLENPDGRQYVVRTIDKDLSKVIPPALRGTFAEKLVQNGIGAAHPYAPLVIPDLADAAKIYHANPKIVWLPHQKTLGDYDTDFAEKLYLFEERPGGNTIGHPDYGNTEKTVSTVDLIEKLFKNHKHKVDQNYVLRARLFDILIGDWDRHDDQWRWGVYEDSTDADVKIYRAIPRDRDQVFFRNDGFLNYLSSRRWFQPGLRKFDDKVDILEGLIFNASYFDRHFLSQMTREDFIKTAEELQQLITDEEIDAAFKNWPQAIYDLSGEEIKRKLRSRRADLVKYAVEMYEFISKEVTVPATNGKNLFEVVALENNQLDVKAYDIDDGENFLIWHRIIDGKETNELRLFGLRKDDQFNFSGDYKSSVKIRLVGGSGDDEVFNNADKLKIVVYDRPNGMETEGNSIKSKIKDADGINSYNRRDWQLNRFFHFPMVSFYTDEGVGLGYNVWWVKHGFRSDPFKSSHTLSLNYFWGNNALVGKYTGYWPSILSASWDFGLNADGSGPTFSQYFYGLGNEYVDFETKFPDNEEAGNASFNIIRGTQMTLEPSFIKNFNNGRSLAFQTSFEYRNLDDSSDKERFAYLAESNLMNSDFNGKFNVGVGIQYQSKRIDNVAVPTRGYDFTLGVKYDQSLTDSEFSNVTFSTNVTTYIPFGVKEVVVLATNLGAVYTVGDYEFFHANNLSQLRGFSDNRFAGDGLIYQATDLRIKLVGIKGLFPATIGVYGSFDHGRAFLKEENNKTWHYSYGGGIYFVPLNIIGLKFGYHKGADATGQLVLGGAIAF